MNATEREIFLQARQGYIGGTDIPAILGISRWKTPLQVWQEKTQAVPENDESTLAMRRGLALEDFLAREFSREHTEFVVFKSKPIVRHDWGFPAGASVDRLVAQREHPRTPAAVLELKTSFRGRWDEGDMPDEYYLQQQWYLAVTELPLCYCVADVGDPSGLRIIEVEPDERIQKRCIDAAREFWEKHVLTGEPPEPSGTEGDGEVLEAMYARTIPEPAVTIEDEGASKLLRAYLNAKSAAAAYMTEAEAAKQKLCALMGEHEKAVIDGWLVTWRKQTRTSIDTKALREAHPDIANEFTRTTEVRVFGTPREAE